MRQTQLQIKIQLISLGYECCATSHFKSCALNKFSTWRQTNTGKRPTNSPCQAQNRLRSFGAPASASSQ